MKKTSTIFYIILLFSAGVMAQDEKVIDQYESEKSKLLEKEIKKRNILGDLYKIKIELRRLDREKNSLMTEFNKVKTKYEILNQQVEELEEKIQTQRDEIRKRLIFMVKFQDIGVVKLIFSSQTPIELDRNLKILKMLTERDYVLLKSYFKNIKTRIAKRDQLKVQKERLAKLNESMQLKENELASSNVRKTTLLSEIQTQRALSLLKLKQIRLKNMPASEEKAKAEAFYETLLKPMVFEEKGQLNPPVKGKVIQKYGYFKDPVYQTKLRYKGVFFGVDVSSPVSSIYDGEVSFSGTIPGFGKSLIISHGDHYYSVYSHLDKILVGAGDSIEKAQTIALSGRSHTFFGNGIYFEIRHFSEPLNPLEWFSVTPTQGDLNAAF